MDGWLDTEIDGQTDGKIDRHEQIHEFDRQVERWIDKLTGKQTNILTDRWTVGLAGRQIDELLPIEMDKNKYTFYIHYI